ncbi:MAG: UPF0182 family protein [Acidimicrobiales bacterium]|nr:UPF0182 family protein [Acidimicrobiales bacterium]
MRAPSDMPRGSDRRERRRRSGRGRIILVVAAVALFLLATSLRGIAGFYTEYLFFDSLGLENVWSGVLGARIVLGLIFTGLFFVLMLANLVIADRLAPRFRPAGPEEELLERYHQAVGRRAGLVRVGVALLFAIIAGSGVSSQWNSWILFTNRVDFGITDPLFDTDVGFYVFQLPFLSFVVNWLFAAFVIIFIVTAVAHYLNGGIRVQAPIQRVTPQVKAHLSVLLGILALIKAVDYWLQRYELTVSSRGVVEGATYTDVNAQLPAIYLLLLIALLSFCLFIANIWRRGWVLPVLAVGLWAFVAIVAGGIYPTFIQRFQVQPAESTKERPYIRDNIEATRAAMNLAEVETQTFEYDESLTASDLIDNAETVRNIRLLDPGIVNDTYQRLQADRGFYRFTDLDVDRYEIDGQTTQVVIGVRELNEAGVPQQSWEGKTLAFTHGYGAAVAPANAVNSAGQPNFIVSGVPVQTPDNIPVDQPQLYIGERQTGYAIVGTDRQEVDYVSDSGETVPFAYDGEGGVRLNSFVRKAAFALRFGDIDPLISDFVQDDSRLIFLRDVRQRVETLAPFLRYDSDPYPVILDGRVYYVLDAYTTSSEYPYAQSADNEQLSSESGLNGSFNYVRNSAKAVVDAYDGNVVLYEMPGEDPILSAYRNAFPELFADFEDMPDGLADHLRYPEDLFRVQTNMWARYHIGDAQDFYEQTGGWEVAQDPGTDVTGSPQTQTTDEQGQLVSTRERRIDPYYLQMRLPDRDNEEFLILRSFVPVSDNDERKELTSFMVGLSDPEDYGQLRVYEMPNLNVDGPAIVNAQMLQNEEISQRISLLNQQGSSVKLGSLLLIPVEDSLLYVRPLYVEAQGDTPVPQLKNVIVAYGDQVEMRSTLREALEAIFGRAPETLEETPTDGGEPTDTPDEPSEPTGTTQEQIAELLLRAEGLFAQADDALDEGDLGTYQARMDAARALVEQAIELGADGTTTTTTTTPADGSA